MQTLLIFSGFLLTCGRKTSLRLLFDWSKEKENETHTFIYLSNVRQKILKLLPIFQSQFRFDNECYLNLPDNHKRVSLSTQPSLELNAEEPLTDENGQIAVARAPEAVSGNESNFNLVSNDFNLASVSMPFSLFKLSLIFVWFLEYIYLDFLFSVLLFLTLFAPNCLDYRYKFGYFFKPLLSVV